MSDKPTTMSNDAARERRLDRCAMLGGAAAAAAAGLATCMGTRVLLGLLSLVLVLGLVPTVPGTTAQMSEPNLIGAPVHLTGFMATYGVPPLEGAKLAVAKINEAGGVLGRPLEIIERDGMSDHAIHGNAAREVIAAGAEVLVTPCDFEMGAPAGQAAQEAGTVGISFCASSSLYGSDALGDKQFTVSMWNQTMGAAAAEFAYTDQGWRTAATIVDQTSEYTTSFAEFFVETFEHLGGAIVSEDAYFADDMQATAQAQRIVELDPQPDVIFVSANMPDYPAIIRVLRGRHHRAADRR